MNLTGSSFVADLQQALRLGMTAALKQWRSLSAVSVSGVERTLYPMIRETALNYLEALGYDYLTREPNFFVIGETSVEGTSRRSDGFVCDPETGSAVYAIEIGMAGAWKFWDDYQKSVKEWTRTGIRGVFILLFETEGGNLDLYRLDSATLRTAVDPEFAIYPLILPRDVNFEHALTSLTCREYLERHGALMVSALTLAARERGEVLRWTTDVIAPVLEQKKRLLMNRIIKSGELTNRELGRLLDPDQPDAIAFLILQGGQNPLTGFDSDMRRRLSAYLMRNKIWTVILCDWMETAEWLADPMIADLLPVDIKGANERKGRWNYGGARPRFGVEIVTGPDPFFDLTGLDDQRYSIGGFVKAAPKPDRDTHVDLQVTVLDGIFPLVVSEPSRHVIWVGTGTGGWGAEWYGRYPEGYQVLWREILSKALALS